jgi:hypothetical protein
VLAELMTRRRIGSAMMSEGPNWVPRRWTGNGARFGSLTLAHLLRWRLMSAGVGDGQNLAPDAGVFKR